MSELPTSEELTQRTEIPTVELRWKRSYDGMSVSEPVLQQLWMITVYSSKTMVTKGYEEWRDVREAGPNDY